MSEIAILKSGAKVEILDSSTDSYQVRYLETGAIRWVPRESFIAWVP